MKTIEFSTTDTNNPNGDTLALYLDLKTAEANAKNILTAVEMAKKKPKKNQWIGFKMKGKINAITEHY